MSKQEKVSTFEKISSSKSVGLAAQGIAAFCTSITPLAAFTPFLIDSFASDRHKKRVENALADINKKLELHSSELKNISDAKYKFISESIAEIFKTIDSQKIDFLKNAISNSISSDDITSLNTDYLSRIVRDLSAEEAKFLIKHSQIKYIFLGDYENTEEILNIKPDSDDEVFFHGLINIGLIYSPVPVMDSTRYEFSPIVEKLVQLLST